MDHVRIDVYSSTTPKRFYKSTLLVVIATPVHAVLGDDVLLHILVVDVPMVGKVGRGLQTNAEGLGKHVRGVGGMGG